MTVQRRPRRWCGPIAALLALVIVPGSLLGACGSGSSGSTSPTGNWTLSSYTNRAGTVAAPAPAATIAFTDDGKVSGTTGCNSFGGRWSTSGSDLRFTAVGMTAKACADPTVDAQETAFGVAFTKSQTYTVDGDTLTIGASDGSTSLRFTRAD